MRETIRNPYLEELKSVIPRVISSIDLDETSSSYGSCDRLHWAWGLIDFSNATFQGAAHGMTRLWVNGLWPYPTNKEIFIDRINSIFLATDVITRRDGSLEEAFPNEGSYCVTALVAFDLLCTLDCLKSTIDQEMRQRWLTIIKPLISFLVKGSETHAIISNHLATAIAALIRWHLIENDEEALKKAELLLDLILEHQSADGWFKEYEGADPGYQSLCVYYLSDAYQQKPELEILEPLRKSFQFLWHFAHPDGSFGGLYGSRYTRFYYPNGVLALADEIPEAAALASFMEEAIISKHVVTLASIDEANLIPMFNSYAWAASIWSSNPIQAIDEKIPSLSAKPFQKFFPCSGLLIDHGTSHHSIVATKKGGIVYHFIDKKLKILDAGVVIQKSSGAYGSSHTLSEFDFIEPPYKKLIVTSPIARMPKDTPGPLQFIILRLLSVTVFNVPFLREWVKRRLVKHLITKKKYWPCKNKRTVMLGSDLKVEDELKLSAGYKYVEDIKYFVPIHMASQGYWQLQDELET